MAIVSSLLIINPGPPDSIRFPPIVEQGADHGWVGRCGPSACESAGSPAMHGTPFALLATESPALSPTL